MNACRVKRKSKSMELSCKDGALFGCGIDLVELAQFKKAIKRWNESFLLRVFTRDELSYSRRNRNASAHLAARFAAKEAAIKAFSQVYPSVKLVLKNIEIKNDLSGRPSIVLNGVSKTLRYHCSISLTHTKNFAAACAWVHK